MIIMPKKEVIDALSKIKDWIKFNGEEYYIPDDAPQDVKEAYKVYQNSLW